MSKPQGMTAITSASQAISSSQVSQGECSGLSSRFRPPASSTNSGTQFPADIKGSIIPGRRSTDGGGTRHAAERACKLATESPHERRQPVRRLERSADDPNVVPESSRHIGASATICGWCPMSWAIACSTSFRLTAQTSHWVCVMMCVGSSLAEDLGKDPVDRDRLARERLDALVDLAARCRGRRSWARSKGEAEDVRRIVAFVRAADEKTSQSEAATISVALAINETIRGCATRGPGQSAPLPLAGRRAFAAGSRPRRAGRSR